MSTPTTTDAAYRRLVQGITDYAIYLLDPDGGVVNWNAGAERAKGYTAAEIVGQHFSRFYEDGDRAAGLPHHALHTARATGKFEGEGWRLRKDGSRFWASVVIDLIKDEDGSLLGFAKITRDLTERKAQADRLQEVSRTLDLALSNMQQGLCLFDRDRRLVLCNERFRQMFGLPEVTVAPGTTLGDMLKLLDGNADDEVSADEVAACPALASAAAWTEQLALLAVEPDGVMAELAWRGRTIAISHRALPDGGWVSTMDDITERRRIENRVAFLAHHDTLTGLPNRLSFQQRLADVLSRRSATKGEPVTSEVAWPGVPPCALLYLDLDRFKPVNDTLGHDAGDELLQAVAGRIRDLLRKTDQVARLGGDEFVVLQVGCEVPHDSSALAERLIGELGRPFVIKGLQVSIGTSIGIALAPGDAREAELLIRHADMALYEAKAAGWGCHRYYHSDMEALIRERRSLEHDLRQGVAAQQFELHYQPIVNVERDEVGGFEALLRWNSPTRGQVPPADFIPPAEEVGLMPAIGEWVLRTACREATGWPGGLVVSVNLSPTQFAWPGLVEMISAVLDEAGLPAARLELEITETAMINDIEGTRATLHRLRALGVQVAMDDFGTGYSSLSFVQSLPFTRIKIDRSFVQNLGSRPESVAIIRAVAGLCSSLGVAATAEGVETEQQAAMLRAERCTDVQGYLYSRPCPAGTVLDWLAAFNSSREVKPSLALRQRDRRALANGELGPPRHGPEPHYAVAPPA